MVANEACLEAHDLCFEARESFKGTLDYGFLGKVIDLMSLSAEEQLDIIYKVKRVERFFATLRQEAETG